MLSILNGNLVYEKNDETLTVPLSELLVQDGDYIKDVYNNKIFDTATAIIDSHNGISFEEKRLETLNKYNGISGQITHTKFINSTEIGNTISRSNSDNLLNILLTMDDETIKFNLDGVVIGLSPINDNSNIKIPMGDDVEIKVVSNTETLDFDLKMNDLFVINDTDREFSPFTIFDNVSKVDDYFPDTADYTTEHLSGESMMQVTGTSDSDYSITNTLGDHFNFLENRTYTLNIELETEGDNVVEVEFIDSSDDSVNNTFFLDSNTFSGTVNTTLRFKPTSNMVGRFAFKVSNSSGIGIVKIKGLSVKDTLVDGESVVYRHIADTVNSGEDIYLHIASLVTMDNKSLYFKDIVILESWLEEVNQTDFVYPFGNIQYSGGIVDGIPSLIVGNFDGSDTYSLFGDFQSPGEYIGKGYRWSNMSESYKNLFCSNPLNNMIKTNGKFYQYRYKITVHKNSKYWNYNVTSGKGLLSSLVNDLNEDIVLKRLSIPLCMVTRYNKSMYHNKHNPYGLMATKDATNNPKPFYLTKDTFNVNDVFLNYHNDEGVYNLEGNSVGDINSNQIEDLRVTLVDNEIDVNDFFYKLIKNTKLSSHDNENHVKTVLGIVGGNIPLFGTDSIFRNILPYDETNALDECVYGPISNGGYRKYIIKDSVKEVSKIIFSKSNGDIEILPENLYTVDLESGETVVSIDETELINLVGNDLSDFKAIIVFKQNIIRVDSFTNISNNREQVIRIGNIVTLNSGVGNDGGDLYKILTGVLSSGSVLEMTNVIPLGWKLDNGKIVIDTTNGVSHNHISINNSGIKVIPVLTESNSSYFLELYIDTISDVVNSDDGIAKNIGTDMFKIKLGIK
jgi:hypothetical protein